jgi:hypothetical protein
MDNSNEKPLLIVETQFLIAHLLAKLVHCPDHVVM